MEILALPLYGIGDVLMTTPALRNIKERLPGARVTYLHMSKATMNVLELNPHVDENIFFPFLTSGRLAAMRFMLGFRGKFDISFNFYPSNRKDYTLASYLVHAPVRIGHRYRILDRKELNFLKNRTVMEDDGLHNVEENLRLLKFLDITAPEPYPLELYLSEEDREFASGWIKERALEGSEIIGIHAGTSAFKDQFKRRWPQERFAAFIGELGKTESETVFLLFGGPEERQLKEALREGSGISGRVYAVEADTVRRSAAIVSMCSRFVANDSGVMHLAAAMQVPTVGIFGPTNPQWVHPWKCPHRIVSLGMGCSPCFRYSPVPLHCPAGLDFACVQELEVSQVLEAVRSLPRQE